MERYYFWENAGEPFGVRCLGTLTGYPTKEALLADGIMEMRIKQNRQSGTPCWILRAAIDETLVEG